MSHRKRICRYCHRPTNDLRGIHRACEGTKRAYELEMNRQMDRALFIGQAKRRAKYNGQ